jgi:hypothetical protein
MRKNGIRQRPPGARRECFIFRMEVQTVNISCEMLRDIEFSLDERLIDDDLGLFVRGVLSHKGKNRPCHLHDAS